MAGYELQSFLSRLDRCTTCGSVVGNRDQHDLWHDTLQAPTEDEEEE